MIIQVIAAFFAIFAFSIIIQVPKKFYCCAGVVGALGWYVYLVTKEQEGVLLGTFFAALVIAMVAHVFARVFKSPATIFLIPGILTLVPGAGMYKSIYQFFLGSSHLAGQYLIETMEIAGMIAFAIFIVDSVVNLIPKRWETRCSIKDRIKVKQKKIKDS